MKPQCKTGKSVINVQIVSFRRDHGLTVNIQITVLIFHAEKNMFTRLNTAEHNTEYGNRMVVL